MLTVYGASALVDRKLVRKSAWSNELGPALIAVPLILWLPKSDIADDLESAQVSDIRTQVLEEGPTIVASSAAFAHGVLP